MERRSTLLYQDNVNAFDAHALDVLSLGELGELGEGIRSKLPGKNVNAWIRELLSDSAVPPASLWPHGARHFSEEPLGRRAGSLRTGVADRARLSPYA